jgi:O-antigen/teichoic acid export membrane protein
LICIVFGIIAISISHFINWATIFNTSQRLEAQLNLLVPIVFACFALQLVAKLITTIYIADQRPSIQGLVNFITAISSLVAVWLLTLMEDSSLLIFGSIYSMIPILILGVLNVFAFSNKYNLYKPSRLYWKKKYFLEIFGLGLSFFVIQLSMIILYTTDNFIITQLFGPEQVVPYSLAFKYFNISLMAFFMVLNPFWSSVTEAYVKKDMEWIRKSMRNLMKLVVLALAIILIMVIFAPKFYHLWVGDKVIVPNALSISMALFFAISVYISPFNYFINGIGKVRVHMYSFLIAALINIPLSIALVKYTSLGIEGIIIATIICISPNLFIFPYQYRQLISGKALGIWNK